MVKILSTGFVGICLACFIVSGCGDKADSPEKDKEEVVRQKLPESESQPEKSAQTTEQKQSESVAAEKPKLGRRRLLLMSLSLLPPQRQTGKPSRQRNRMTPRKLRPGRKSRR